MSLQVLTTNDLQEFKVELLEEIRNILTEQKSVTSKKWLKSIEVRNLLNISPGTLQTLRINGTLPFTKIGGTNYYNFTDIEKILSKKMP
jgi:hypothetical protein